MAQPSTTLLRSESEPHPSLSAHSPSRTLSEPLPTAVDRLNCDDRPSTELAKTRSDHPSPCSSDSVPSNPNILPNSLLLAISNHPDLEIDIDHQTRIAGSPHEHFDFDPFQSVYPLTDQNLLSPHAQDQHGLPALLDHDLGLPADSRIRSDDPTSAPPDLDDTRSLSDATFHALLFASLADQIPSTSPVHETALDALLPPTLPQADDHHQHAQDLLQALQALQTGIPTSPDGIPFTQEPLLSADLEMLLSASSAQVAKHVPPSDPLASPDLAFLFRPPPSTAQTDTETDLLLARLDERLSEDARLDGIDKAVEEAVEANEAYGVHIRNVLDKVAKALERGEQLVTIADFCVKEIENRSSAPSLTCSVFAPVASTSSSPPPLSRSTFQTQINSIDDKTQTPLTLVAKGTKSVSLPWFKYRFGFDLPSHEDGTKRDKYNALLHQQAWQPSERRKLEEEVTAEKQKKGDSGHSIDWLTVSSQLPERSPAECKMQWTERQDPVLNKSKWATQEVDRLFEIVRRRSGRDWRAVAAELGTRRTPAECVKQYRMVTQERREWTEPDDVLLKEGMSMYGQNWQAVANHCGRSSNQCINRWSKTLRPDIKKGKWDASEDVALKNAVAACGMVWKDVAPRVRGRTDAQCRERWCNILDPKIVVGNWSKFEDEEILRMREKEGKTWSEISKSFNGRRTDNHCMRRYSELTRVDGKKKPKPVSSQHVERKPHNALGRALVASGAGFTRRNQVAGAGSGGAATGEGGSAAGAGTGAEKEVREAKRVRMEVG